jgi:hypothetical protein
MAELIKAKYSASISIVPEEIMYICPFSKQILEFRILHCSEPLPNLEDRLSAHKSLTIPGVTNKPDLSTVTFLPLLLLLFFHNCLTAGSQDVNSRIQSSKHYKDMLLYFYRRT